MRRLNMHLLVAFTFLCMSFVPTFAQQLTGFGEWRLYYFMDEFGDLMYDKPFLETKIKNAKGQILTIAFTNKIDSGDDVMSMMVSDGYCTTTLDRNASVSLKTSDGKVYKFSIPDSHLLGGQIFIRNQKDLGTIAAILNKGNCKISISAHWGGDTYVSPNHVWNFPIMNQTKEIKGAYLKYLR
ncbi:MAG: hypothetical protein ACI3ZB_05045 [Prevotella sp.]